MSHKDRDATFCGEIPVFSVSIMLLIGGLVVALLAALIGGIVYFVIRSEDRQPPRD